MRTISIFYCQKDENDRMSALVKIYFTEWKTISLLTEARPTLDHSSTGICMGGGECHSSGKSRGPGKKGGLFRLENFLPFILRVLPSSNSGISLQLFECRKSPKILKSWRELVAGFLFLLFACCMFFIYFLERDRTGRYVWNVVFPGVFRKLERKVGGWRIKIFDFVILKIGMISFSFLFLERKFRIYALQI